MERWADRVAGRRAILNAPEVPVGADEDRPFRDGDRGQGPLLERIATEDLKRRPGGKHQRLAFQVCDVEPAGGVVAYTTDGTLQSGSRSD